MQESFLGNKGKGTQLFANSGDKNMDFMFDIHCRTEIVVFYKLRAVSE